MFTELQRCNIHVEFGLQLNQAKTKVLLNTHGVISVSGETIEQVQHFKYHGSLINQQADSIQDIKACIAIVHWKDYHVATEEAVERLNQSLPQTKTRQEACLEHNPIRLHILDPKKV